MTSNFDSLIFDMDGTLWDAVDSYCEIWNKTFSQLCIDTQPVTRQRLLECMGMPIDEIFRRVVSANVDEKIFLKILDENEKRMMPILGGTLYPGVTEGIQQLSRKYRLFMISNCGADGLDNFLHFTHLDAFFEGTLTYGETLCGKAQNINTLIKRFDLKSPVYIGDTQGDCDSAHTAGIPMIFAAYGFGQCDNAEFTVCDFNQLVNLL